jgi:hypothetical protein
MSSTKGVAYTNYMSARKTLDQTYASLKFIPQQNHTVEFGSDEWFNLLKSEVANANSLVAADCIAYKAKVKEYINAIFNAYNTQLENDIKSRKESKTTSVINPKSKQKTLTMLRDRSLLAVN